MKNKAKTGRWVWLTNYCCVLMCVAAVGLFKLEFQVTWTPGKNSQTGQLNIPISTELLGLFSTPTQQTNACYSAGKCIYSDYGPPKSSRLHTLNFPPSLILLGPVNLVMAGLILVANLVGLLLYGWRGILAVLIAVPVGVFVIGFFLTPVFINDYDDILQESFPHWRACQSEPNTPICSMDPDCHDWHCTPKGIFSVQPSGSANWVFTRLAPTGLILFSIALLLTLLAAPESIRRLRRLRRSPPPA